ncbi:MAG: ComEC/Rec2 family competence protein [Fibrobacterota bacterium]
MLLATVAGIAALNFLPFTLPALPYFGVVFFVAAVPLFRISTPAGFLLTACAAGLVYSNQNHRFHTQKSTFAPPKIHTVHYCEPPLYSQREYTIQKVRCCCNTVVLLRSPQRLKPGQKMTIRSSPAAPHDTAAAPPWAFDTRAWHRREGIAAERTVDSVLAVSSGAATHIYRFITAHINTAAEECAPYYRSLTLRERYRLSPHREYLMRSAGLVHLLALSGLHTGILLVILTVLAAPLPLPRYLKSLILLIPAAFFITLSGSSISGNRALIMAALFFAAPLFQRQTPAATILCVTAVILLATDPQELFSPGFQLSFSATAAILLTLFFVRQKLPRHVHPFAVLLLSPTVIFIFTAPILAFHFQEIAPWSPATNLFFTPLFSVSIGLLITALFLSVICPFGGELLISLAAKVDAFLFSLLEEVLIRYDIVTITPPVCAILLAIIPTALMIPAVIRNKKQRGIALCYTLLTGISVHLITQQDQMLLQDSRGVIKTTPQYTLINRALQNDLAEENFRRWLAQRHHGKAPLVVGPLTEKAFIPEILHIIPTDSLVLHTGKEGPALPVSLKRRNGIATIGSKNTEKQPSSSFPAARKEAP